MDLSSIPPAHAARYMHCSPRHRHVYVETPKVACTSVKLTLCRMELAPFRPSFPAGVIHNRALTPLLSPKQLVNFDRWIGEAFVFTFVRDPFERAVSAYLDKIVRGFQQADDIRVKLENLGWRGKEIGFEDFLLALSHSTLEKLDNHYRPQALQIMHGKLRYDFIGRFETISADLNYIIRRCGFEPKKMLAVSQGHATNASERVKALKTRRAKRLAEEVYAADYEAFGY